LALPAIVVVVAVEPISINDFAKLLGLVASTAVTTSCEFGSRRLKSSVGMAVDALTEPSAFAVVVEERAPGIGTIRVTTPLASATDVARTIGVEWIIELTVLPGIKPLEEMETMKYEPGPGKPPNGNAIVEPCERSVGDVAVAMDTP
jgi:hypothetical protein